MTQRPECATPKNETRARSWFLTINNPRDNSLPQHASEKYAVWQLEKGESGTPHLQCLIQMRNPIGFNTIKKLYPTAHIEVPRSLKASIKYCQKEDTRQEGPWTRGDEPNQGSRTDLAELAEVIIEEGLESAIQQFPEKYIQYHVGMEKLAKRFQPKPQEPSGFKDIPWQRQIIDIVKGSAHDRKIHWVHDSQGHRGKSRLLTHLICNYNATELRGRIPDMAFQYNKEPIVVFDIPRTRSGTMDHIYEFSEQLKNGRIISTKYESCMKLFATPHVFIFSNSMPEMDKWSRDRYDIIDLDQIELSPEEIYIRNATSSPAVPQQEASPRRETDSAQQGSGSSSSIGGSRRSLWSEAAIGHVSDNSGTDSDTSDGFFQPEYAWSEPGYPYNSVQLTDEEQVSICSTDW